VSAGTPISDRDGRAPLAHQARDESRQGETTSQASILIVDDDILTRKLLEAMLQHEGYLTATAANGPEALATIALHAPDLILLDIMMPGMDGCQLANTLKADPATSNIPIIMVTALADRSGCLAALNAGAEEFLTKPVDRAELRPRVRNLLRLKALGDVCLHHNETLEQKIQARTAELQRFRSAMDVTDDGIFMVNRTSMQFAEVNAAACAMLGFTRAELLQLGPVQLAEVTRERLASVYDGVIAGNPAAGPSKIHLRRKDGSRFVAEVRLYAIRQEADWIVVGVGRDITEQTEREDQSLRFRAAMESSGDGILLIDRASMRYIDVNQTLCDLVGYTRQELLGKTPMELFQADRALLERDYDAIIADNHSIATSIDGQYRRKDGSLVPIETRRSALHTDAGWIIVGAARDITERKASEKRIKRLNRVHAVLSGINTLIVRVRDKEELFREACRIAVDDGHFKTASIGILDRETMRIRPVALAGAEEGFLAALQPRLAVRDDDPAGSGVAARAIMTKKPVVIDDVEHDPLVLTKKECIERGILSFAVLPLLVSEEAAGVLALFAGEAGFFDEEEMKLLTDLAGNISFALDHIDKRGRLDYLAYYDAITGLANRALFHERLAQSLVNAVEQRRNVAVVLLDIERFRSINQTFGRQAGDALLKELAARMTHYSGIGRVARIESDQFAVMIPEFQTEEQVARRIEQRLTEVFDPPFHIGETELRISVKFGIAMFPANGTDADTLFRNAEAALKNAKKSGERYLFYAQAMNERVAEKLTLENQLRQALDKGEFVLHYQPKVDLVSGSVTSTEALIRWNDPRAGLVPPGRFIPILEETGLITAVGRWALRRAIADYLRWRNAGLPAVRIAVNVSPLQLRNRDFIDEVKAAIGIDAQAAAGLELEITESLIMEDVKHSISTLQAIRAMGVTIAIDDFGTGFSSLSHLARLPVDTLKIDRSFVLDMMNGPEGLALVSTIINLAHSLRLKVVAEGVETGEQKRLLELLGCDEMQGYLFSKPVPFEQMTEMLPAPAGIAPAFS